VASRLGALLILLAGIAACGGDRADGEITGGARRSEEVAASDARQARTREALAADARAPADSRQILFGDLHVHTTYSLDAFTMELPIMGLQGIHTPADACDFARHCAGLDFFSLNDHAEGLTPEHWAATKESIRRCNAVAGDPQDADLIAFTGWEWTQVALRAEDHWGHKNVIFLGTDEDELPARPISSRPDDGGVGLFNNVRQALRARFIDPLHWKDYADLEWLIERVAGMPLCPKGVPTRELPADCHESAPTPAELYAKLDEWGFDALVIPHGNAWGLYTPTDATWDKALSRTQHDPDRQRLLEIMSGHGNAEEYRAFRPVESDDEGVARCPAPSDEFLPCCWQAGEIARRRCGELSDEACEALVEDARALAVQAGPMYRSVFPAVPATEWLDCDQCRDCFKPAFSYRPQESSQYAMALSSFEEPEPDGQPLRFRFGFIASTDDHTSRPGTGYKQYERRKMTFATGLARSWFEPSYGEVRDPDRPQRAESPYVVPDGERVASFSYPGGIVAVHSAGRSREEVWAAFRRREVYGTSGPRILLWFDLLNGPEGRASMGAEVEIAEAPRFEVRAAGDFVQKPGCPRAGGAAPSTERMERLCVGECYHPGDARHPIRAIEVVRIRPQIRPGEPVADLIEDPWRRIPCAPAPDGCVATFEDPEFMGSGRDALYYVRALQEETPAINGANLRTTFDAAGQPLSVDPCFGDGRTPLDDDCLAPVQERAWSSPIFVDQRR
jgi:hypothetical protein